MSTFGRLTASIITGLLSALWFAFVAQRLWWWFIQPLGAQHVAYWHAYGLLTVGSFMSLWAMRLRPDEPKEEFSHTLGVVFAKMFVAAYILGIGAAVHAWGMGQ